MPLFSLLLASLAVAASDSRPSLLSSKSIPSHPSPLLPSPPSMSARETVLQIVNNVAGAGILTLSAGMTTGVGVIPATVLCLLMGAISAYTFYMVGEACELVQATTFKELWACTLGEASSWMVDAAIALMCLSVAM